MGKVFSPGEGSRTLAALDEVETGGRLWKWGRRGIRACDSGYFGHAVAAVRRPDDARREPEGQDKRSRGLEWGGAGPATEDIRPAVGVGETSDPVVDGAACMAA
jgi:hypothetical protein